MVFYPWPSSEWEDKLVSPVITAQQRPGREWPATPCLPPPFARPLRSAVYLSGHRSQTSVSITVDVCSGRNGANE